MPGTPRPSVHPTSPAIDTAAVFSANLLPEAGYRQWVLSIPWTLRYTMALDPQLLSMVLSNFLRSIFCWQRRCARHWHHQPTDRGGDLCSESCLKGFCCAGCIGDGLCHSGNTIYHCGVQGALCKTCAWNQFCSNGGCYN